MSESFEKAKSYAFLLLKFRLRSERELYTRLKQKKFTEEVIAGTLSFLKDRGFIDDVLFTKNWIDYRLKKSYGLNRIREELRLKGIDREILDNQLQQVQENYREAEAVKKTAQERLRKIKDRQPQEVKRRLYAYLLRRGYSRDIVTDAIDEIL